jgi:hypothetical protein
MLDHNDIIKKRSKYLAPSFSVSYDRPLHIVRGRGQYLYDSNGKEYLDMVNNISHVGHCHPKVIEAANNQNKELNTNTRYLCSAVCIAYAVLGRGDSLSIAGDIIKGLCLTNYLSSEEIKAIIYLVCIRLCISVTMAKYRSEIFPENKYLMVSNIEAWEFLYFMYQEDLETWSKRLVQYVRP